MKFFALVLWSMCGVFAALGDKINIDATTSTVNGSPVVSSSSAMDTEWRLLARSCCETGAHQGDVLTTKISSDTLKVMIPAQTGVSTYRLSLYGKERSGQIQYDLGVDGTFQSYSIPGTTGSDNVIHYSSIEVSGSAHVVSIVQKTSEYFAIDYLGIEEIVEPEIDYISSQETVPVSFDGSVGFVSIPNESSLSGGLSLTLSDNTNFSLVGRVLKFKAPVNPSNSYSVTITAESGGEQASEEVTVQVSSSIPSNTTGVNRKRPNVVIFFADDMSMGDIKALNPSSKIPTPHLDRLVNEGMNFVDAHSNSSVCTPTRYGLLTGRYAWRTKLKKSVIDGSDASLIKPERLTLPKMMSLSGYQSIMVGKWHLGLDRDPSDNVSGCGGEGKYTKPFGGGPIGAGFDYFWGITASLDFAPYAYLENNIPLKPTHTCQAAAGGAGFWRQGYRSEDFVHVDVLDSFGVKAQEVIRNHVSSRGDQPFFVYMPVTSPHTPHITPVSYKNASQAGSERGHLVYQTDSILGQVYRVLDSLDLTQNTIILFTSDNGTHVKENIERTNGHYFEKYITQDGVEHSLRGKKADIWEGGHRVPFIVAWEGVIEENTESKEVISLTDIMPTLASIVGYPLPSTASEDGYSLLPVLLQDSSVSYPIREATVHHSINGVFAVRKGKWKYIHGITGSGGWTSGGSNTFNHSTGQLYDMENDISETTNLFSQHPDTVDALKNLLVGYTGSLSRLQTTAKFGSDWGGRSTPAIRAEKDLQAYIDAGVVEGEKTTNTERIVLWGEKLGGYTLKIRDTRGALIETVILPKSQSFVWEQFSRERGLQKGVYFMEFFQHGNRVASQKKMVL